MAEQLCSEFSHFSISSLSAAVFLVGCDIRNIARGKKAQTYTVTLTPGCVEKLSSFAALDKQRKEKINLHHLFFFSEKLKGKVPERRKTTLHKRYLWN